MSGSKDLVIENRIEQLNFLVSTWQVILLMMTNNDPIIENDKITLFKELAKNEMVDVNASTITEEGE